MDPLFELAVALYGLQRGDTCWGGRSQPGEPAVFLHQTQYLCHVVDKHIRDHNGGKALKKYTTPLPIEDYKVEESVPDHIPRLTKTDAASIGGEVNWAARGSRYDLTLFGKRIVQRITM